MFSLFKKLKIVAVHDGSFHTDDVFAVATLSLAYEDRVRIIRTRDESVIVRADIAVDVGSEYDEKRGRFDHHQKGGAGVRSNGIPYASFGLVWKKYGLSLAGSQKAADAIDRMLVCPIDGPDNGIDITKPLFTDVGNYGVHSVVSSFLPTWKENLDVDRQFLKAVEFAKKVLAREIKRTNDFLEGAEYTESCYATSDNKRVVVVDKPIGRVQIVAVLGQFPDTLYAVYPSRSDEKWSVVGIQKMQGSFEVRKPLPESWAGLRDESLQKMTGVPDAVFCHTKRFLAVAESREGAIALAEKALNS